jgi:RP/EB family microtubule-associated protein
MATQGMMSSNNFMGKSALLSWLNSTLSLRLEKIEDVSSGAGPVRARLPATAPAPNRPAPPPPPLPPQTCTGAVACQLMDCLHPGSVNMKRVDFNVRNDYEFTNNYKELQQAFTKVSVDRAFNVSQLSKGKRQDNNEFMQWFKGYWDSISGGQDVAAAYDAPARRAVCKSGDWKKVRALLASGLCGRDEAGAAPFGRYYAHANSAPHPRLGPQFSLGEGAPRPADAAAAPADATIPAVRRGAAAPAAPRSVGPAAKVGAARPSSGAAAPAPAADPQAAARLAALSEAVAELKLKVETAERERDFYFDKLRDIEILCQAPELADVPVGPAAAAGGQRLLSAAACSCSCCSRVRADEADAAVVVCCAPPALPPQVLKVVERVLYAADAAEAKQAMAEAQEQYGGQLVAGEPPAVEA